MSTKKNLEYLKMKGYDLKNEEILKIARTRTIDIIFHLHKNGLLFTVGK